MTTDDLVVDVSQDWVLACDVQQRFMQGLGWTSASMDHSAQCRQVRALGGDCYDFLPLTEDRLAMVVGDASGKGVAAALMIASVQSSLRTAALFTGNDPAALLKIVNLQAYDSSLADRYATVFYGVFDRSTRMLRYVNAGHTPPVVLRRNDSINKLETRGVHLLECFLIHATRREPCSLIPAIWSSPAPTESLALSIRATECEAGLASLGCKTC